MKEVFTPTEEQIARSIKILLAYKDALERKLGVIAVDGRMIDGPIVDRARRIVDEARAAGIMIPKEVTNL